LKRIIACDWSISYGLRLTTSIVDWAKPLSTISVESVMRRIIRRVTDLANETNITQMMQ